MYKFSKAHNPKSQFLVPNYKNDMMIYLPSTSLLLKHGFLSLMINILNSLKRYEEILVGSYNDIKK